MENMIEVRNLVKSYKSFKLNSISFDIPKGMIVGLIGGNGSGKTTIMKCILSLIFKNSGEINIFSKNKVKALPSGNYQVKKRDLQMNKHQQFTNYYNQNNFPSMVVKDDEKAYILYNDANKVNEQNGNENYEKLLD